ncbi:hypothetical protein SH1V18_24820 [Vallitalea longa]|uniref:Uncharacterized protein n=1 Tax=Vallitalea longa TaxID=2936439 RepID=A0A9W6DFZ5_9FIRM|nr:hypothetical protein [Vallitalea longa]GKX30002.1 hypothetical protein SH1V18_24820 [Vallitalea longa]
MNKKNVRRRNKNRYVRNRQNEQTYSSKIAIKVFICFIILLATLYFKKYEVKVGEFDVDSIYEVLYYNEDFKELSNKVLRIGSDTAENNSIDMDSNQK